MKSVAQRKTYRAAKVIRVIFLLMSVLYTSQRSARILDLNNYSRLTLLCHPIHFLFVNPAFCLGLPLDSQSPTTPLPPANHQHDHHRKTGLESKRISSSAAEQSHD